MLEFKGWPKTPRLKRDIVITEKIDGTNAAVIVQRVGDVLGKEPYRPSHGPLVGAGTEFALVEGPDGDYYMVGAQSRKRIIFPETVKTGGDNQGFAQWVWSHAQSLVTVLGEGYHYGEWWGKGVQRNYGQEGKRFSLFNVHRYGPLLLHPEADKIVGLDVVPILYSGPWSNDAVDQSLFDLRVTGSVAAPGFMNPEGVILFHSQANLVFKALLEDDDVSKTEAQKRAFERGMASV